MRFRGFACQVFGLILLSVSTGVCEEIAGNVAVERAEPGGAGDRGGLKAGDVLLGWQVASCDVDLRSASLLSPVDVVRLEVEYADRCTVTLTGRRGTDPLSIVMPPGAWSLATRPMSVLEADYLLLPAKADGLPEHNLDRAIDQLTRLADVGDDPLVAAWARLRAATLCVQTGRLDQARGLFERAVQTAAGADPEAGAVFRMWQSTALASVGELDAALANLRGAADSAGSSPLVRAYLLEKAGTMARKLSDLAGAEAAIQESLDIRSDLVPDSLATAASLNALGSVAFVAGDLDRAEGLYRRALKLRTGLAPGSLEQGASLNNLGNVAVDRGDLATAETCYRQDLAITKKLAPGSENHAGPLTNLGIVADLHGDYATAERRHREAISILEAEVPGSLDLAHSYTNLAIILNLRGDQLQSEEFFRKNLALTEGLAPASFDMATSLGNLGLVVMDRDLDEAEHLLKRALRLKQALAPHSVHVASTWNALGELSLRRERLDEAEHRFRKDLEILEELSPRGLHYAGSLFQLGLVAHRKGVLAEAESLHRRSLTIRQRLAPGSRRVAESHHGLSLVLRDAGKTDAAVEQLELAVEALRSQIGRLGGTRDIHTTFRSGFQSLFHDLISLLLELGRDRDAFYLFEQSRAESLLAMLAERDLVFEADIPAELDRERRRANLAYELLQSQTGELTVTDNEQLQALAAELRAVRSQQQSIREQIRAATPRLAALQYPEPLNLDRAQQLLDPGTTALAYSVGTDQTHLFVLAADGGYSVQSLGIGEQQLREKIHLLRGLIEGQAQVGLVRDAAAALYRLLIEPAEAAVEAADRVLVVPDGPLNLLPFAVLVGTSSQPGRYLVERKPIASVPSLTVLKQLRASHEAQSSMRVVAFADPAYGGSPRKMASIRLRGKALTQLPASRAEARALTRLYGDSATVFAGDDATEERAKKLSKNVAVVHFATHVVADQRSPLDTAIVLATPSATSADNGLLQAWEVFESVRLNADLVTLSGCHTAFGEEVAGEGIIGLTRAFHFAGARAVLASLWRVEDEATAGLMERMYVRLRAGESTSDALRQAQVDLIRGPIELTRDPSWLDRLLGHQSSQTVDASHPFYWAAFTLQGDWQ